MKLPKSTPAEAKSLLASLVDVVELWSLLPALVLPLLPVEAGVGAAVTLLSVIPPPNPPVLSAAASLAAALRLDAAPDMGLVPAHVKLFTTPPPSATP